MTSKIIANGIIKALLIIVAIAMLLFFLYQIQSVIIYLIVSLILTLITSPFVGFLKRKLKFSNTIAVVFTMFLLMLTFVGLIMMFVPLILAQSENLSLLDTKSIENSATQLTNQFKIYLTNHHINAGNYSIFRV